MLSNKNNRGSKSKYVSSKSACNFYIYVYTCGKIEIFGWNSGVLTYNIASGPTISSSSSANVIVNKVVIEITSFLSFGASRGVWNFTPTLSGNILILT